MSNDHDNRNLLFGLIALRVGFISDRQLIDAICLWTMEPQKGLGELLVEQDSLGAETHSLLESVVDAHVRTHGDSLSKSLASLAPIDPDIKRILEEAGIEVPAELTHFATSKRATSWIRRHHHWVLSGVVTGSVAILVAATIVAFAPQSRDTTLVMIGLVIVVMIAALCGLILVGIPYVLGLALQNRWNRRFLLDAGISPKDWEKAARLHLDESIKHMDLGMYK